MSVRQTSIAVYNTIKDNGLLSKTRWMIYDALFKHGPCTANELFQKTRGSIHTTQANYHPRLGELRDCGVVYEVRERPCTTNGNVVIEWDVTDRLPVKFEKPQRERCNLCGGKGYLETQQGRFDL